MCDVRCVKYSYVISLQIHVLCLLALVGELLPLLLLILSSSRPKDSQHARDPGGGGVTGGV